MKSVVPLLTQTSHKMLLKRCSVQHILTERIFRTVFNNSAFTRRNIIAREIENVVDALSPRGVQS